MNGDHHWYFQNYIATKKNFHLATNKETFDLIQNGYVTSLTLIDYTT